MGTVTVSEKLQTFRSKEPAERICRQRMKGSGQRIGESGQRMHFVGKKRFSWAKKNTSSIPDGESLPFYPSVLKLVVCSPPYPTVTVHMGSNGSGENRPPAAKRWSAQ